MTKLRDFLFMMFMLLVAFFTTGCGYQPGDCMEAVDGSGKRGVYSGIAGNGDMIVRWGDNGHLTRLKRYSARPCEKP